MSFLRGLFGSREVNELEKKGDVNGLKAILTDDRLIAFKRICAAEALGSMGTKVAIPSLISALNDKDASVSAAAASALEKLPDKSAVSPLIELLKRPDDIVVRHAALALGKHGDSAAVEPLLTVLNAQADNPDITIAAIDALSEIKDRRAVESIIKSLKESKHSTVREHAVRALGKIGDPRAVDALIAKLKDYDYFYIRKTAAYTLYVFYKQEDLDPALRQKILTHWRSWYLT